MELLREIDNQAVLEAYGIDVSVLAPPPRQGGAPTVIHNLDASVGDEDVNIISHKGEDDASL